MIICSFSYLNIFLVQSSDEKIYFCITTCICDEKVCLNEAICNEQVKCNSESTDIAVILTLYNNANMRILLDVLRNKTKKK